MPLRDKEIDNLKKKTKKGNRKEKIIIIIVYKVEFFFFHIYQQQSVEQGKVAKCRGSIWFKLACWKACLLDLEDEIRYLLFQGLRIGKKKHEPRLVEGES